MFAGAHTPREEHQPQPGARAEQPQTSVAVAQSEAEETLRESGGGIAKRALVLGGRERSNVKKSADVGAHVSEGRKQSIWERDFGGCVGCMGGECFFLVGDHEADQQGRRPRLLRHDVLLSWPDSQRCWSACVFLPVSHGALF